ncbi:MAG: type IV pilus twitching motility protein PilT [Anaerovoracaceae bacterium]|jgi:twitching motility protein PilT
MKVINMLKEAVNMGVSDIFLIPGTARAYKKGDKIIICDSKPLHTDDMIELVREIYDLTTDRKMDNILDKGDDDFSFSLPGVSRFRVNVFLQRGSLAAVIRVITFELPKYTDINIPEEVMAVAGMKKGLTLITGPAGSGKSTTLACIIDQINRNRNAHVITLEDPIEYLHRHKKSIVTQREIGVDTTDYVTGLRAALRQAPNVILLGELRDYETIKTAITAAETGHLVLSTLHTIGAANTIDRIIDVFPQNQQEQIRIQLAYVLQVVVSQQLISTIDEKIIPVFEIMNVNSAIRNMIREAKSNQIDGAIMAGRQEGMRSMDISLLELYKDGLISEDVVINNCLNKGTIKNRIEDLRKPL